MDFIIYDIGLLVLFVIGISIFLYLKGANLKKEGILFLYRTQWGVRLINHVGNKYKKTLKVLSYISVGIGYILTAGILYLFGKLVWIYITLPQVVRQIKVPPIMPLIPYVNKIVPGLPDFFFTYWIIIIAIIAITHELAHGIFAAYYKVKIKTTGFGFFPFFLPVFLAAFVELDEKRMVKKKNFPQRTILSAGTFANVLTAILSFIVMLVFFSLAFAPSGVVFNSYAYSPVILKNINQVNGISVSNLTLEEFAGYLKENETFNEIVANEITYVGVKKVSTAKLGDQEIDYAELYYDAPAVKAGLTGAIQNINGVKINSVEKLSEELSKYSPGESITIKTKTSEEVLEYNIILDEHPAKEGTAWLGIGFEKNKRSGVIGKVIDFISSFKKSNIYYESKIDKAGVFIYNLLWWLILISISVALMNMLPLGIFDGARFFYLTILAITKNEKKARKTLSVISYVLLFLVLLLMIFWAISFFR